MPPEVLELKRSGFKLSGKVGRLIYRTRDGKSHIYGLREPKKGGKMAKIKYASFITGLSGKSGSTVFYRSPSSAFGYMRNHVTPIYTETNEQRGKEFENLGVQYRKIIEPAREDLANYARKYSQLPASGSGEMAVRANNGMAVFIAMCWRIKRTNPEAVNLASLTLSDIMTVYNINSVASAVDQGFLPAVPGWEDYTEDFDT